MMKHLVPMIISLASICAHAVPQQETTARLYMTHGEFMNVAGTVEKFTSLPADSAKQLLGFQVAAMNLSMTICTPATEAKYNAEFMIQSLPKLSAFAANSPNTPLILTSIEYWKTHRLNNGCIRSADTTYGVKVADVVDKFQSVNSKPVIIGYLFGIHDKMAIASCATVSPFQTETDATKIDTWMRTLISGSFTPAILNTNAGLFFSYKLSQEIFKNQCGSISA